MSAIASTTRGRPPGLRLDTRQVAVAEGVRMSQPTIGRELDVAAKVLADPTAYADDE
jgi:hypothetical protein